MDSQIDLSKLEILVKSLNDSLDVIGTRLAVATAAVVIGLLIEYEEDARRVFWALVNNIQHCELTSFRSLEAHVKRAVFGGVFITLGVGAELWYEHRTSVIESSLQSANGQIVAFLNRKAGEADLATQGLKTEAQHSKERADGLEGALQTERQKTSQFQTRASNAQRALVADLAAEKKFSADAASRLEDEKRSA